MAQLAEKLSNAIAKAVADAVDNVIDASHLFGKQAGTILKRDEQRLVLAVTNVVTELDGTKVVDHDGDVIDIRDLEESFIRSFAKGGEDKSGVMHEQDGGADVAMFFTISKAEWEALKPYIGKEIGLAKIRVKDNQYWADVKSGKLKQVSIEGGGERAQI